MSITLRSIQSQRRVAFLLVGLTLSSVPALAQGRRGDGERARDSGGRAERREATERRRETPRQERQQAQRQDNGPRAERPQGRDRRADDRQDRVRRWPTDDSQGRDRAQAREAFPRRDDRNDSRDRDGRFDRRDGGRDRVYVRPRVVPPRYVEPRYRAYSYRAPRRVYVVPYGYRPYGYGPGWNVDLYFGRPFGRHIYGQSGYGYYSIAPGFAYGSLRIVDAPRDAQVFVDGYYAGVVDEYDGIFQRLNLEPGPHHIEIDVVPGDSPLEFDVHIVPGETVTYHARY